MTLSLPYLVAAIALASASNVMLRRGMRHLAAGGGKPSLWGTLTHALRSPSVWAGSLGYAAAMGCWLEVLGRVEISLVYPIFTGSVTFGVMAASTVVLGERIERRRVIGAALMIAGICLAFWG